MLDRYLPNRRRPNDPLFWVAMAMIVSGVLQVIVGALILSS